MDRGESNRGSYRAIGSVVTALALIAASAVLLNVTLVSSWYRVTVIASLTCIAIACGLLVSVLMREAGSFLKSLSLIGLFVAVALVLQNGRRMARMLRPAEMGEVFVVPDRTVGWIRVEYGVPNAPKLRREGSRHLIFVPLSGVVRTSDMGAGGDAGDEVYYEHNGSRVPAMVAVPGRPEVSVDSLYQAKCVFVGTFDDLRRSAEAGNRLCDPGLRLP